MNPKSYDIFFKGDLETGAEREQVKVQFGDRFKITGTKLEHFFSGTPVILKRAVDGATARRIQKAVSGVGAICHIRPCKHQAPEPVPTEPKLPDPAGEQGTDAWPEDSPFADLPGPMTAAPVASPSTAPPITPPIRTTPPASSPFVAPGERAAIRPPPTVNQLASLDLACDPTPAQAEAVVDSLYDPVQTARRKQDQLEQQERERNSHYRGCMAVVAVVLGISVFCVSWFWERHRSISQPNAVLVSETPEQTDIEGTAAFPFQAHLITPVAEFTLDARVLSYKRYSSGRAHEVMPLDLALGWGRMSDNRVLKYIDISQSNRFYFWRTRVPPIPLTEIMRYSANMHMVPATSAIRSRLMKARKGHVIRLKGKLIYLTTPEGETLKSSTTRDDTGPGACEIIFVEDFEIL